MGTTVLILSIVAAVLILGGLFLIFGPASGRGGTTTVEPPAAPPAPPAAGPQHDLTDQDLPPPSAVIVDEAPPASVLDVPPPSAGRMVRLRERLARSQGGLGRGLFALLSRDTLDEDTWEEIEDTLLTSDLGVAATQQVVESLRTKVRVLGTRTPEGLRELVEGELLGLLGGADRSLATARHPDGRPAVVMVVGVNGTGKTTTCGKLARALVGDGRTVLLGAADTFRAAAADQLETWGSRVGASVVRGPEGG